MADAPLTLSVTAKRRIFKYAEGADPKVDAPISVEEKEVVLTGEDAKEALEQMGISEESAFKIASNGGN